jgi:hypothetical protein
MNSAKVLSLWQPWASLVAIGAKCYETRHWNTKYRGPLVIHAAQNLVGLREFQAQAFSVYSMLQPVEGFPLVRYAMPLFRKYGLTFSRVKNTFPLGRAICVVDLVDVLRVEQVRDHISNWERAFGNYADGRYAWKLENLRVFPAPITMPGGQRLFNREIEPALLGEVAK